MQDPATSGRDAPLHESVVSERAGDRAREDGNLLLALVHYRNAAELRSADPRLAAKIDETAAARAVSRRPPAVAPTPSTPRHPSYSSIATLILAGILTAGNVLTVSRPNTPEKPVPSASAAAVDENSICPFDPYDWTTPVTVESAALAAAETPAGDHRTRSHHARHKAGTRSRLAGRGGKAKREIRLGTKKTRPVRVDGLVA
jgi:hypothetical protein